MKFAKLVAESEKFRHVRRHWLTVAFLLGFVVDNITLNNVEQLFDNIVLASYVVLAMVSLLLLYASAAGRFPERHTPFIRKYAPLLVQFAFGGLLSGMLIFYGRSGSWTESWPFLLLILGVIYGNETIRDRATRLVFNLTILYVGLYSYVVLIIPVLTGKMGAWIFVGSGLIALFIMYWFVQILYKIVPRFMELQMRKIVFVLGCIFACFNFLYFTNIIPPIPLSLKDVGVYHSVVRFSDGTYQLKYENGAWWEWFKNSDTVFHPETNGGGVYCFASVFAPTKLSIDIYHHWEYYDEELGEWIEYFRSSYPISGGRSGGYRGYTLIKNFRNAKWRCSVETERGQVLGREVFVIDPSEEPGTLVTEVR